MIHDLAMDPNLLTPEERRRRIVDLDSAINETRHILRAAEEGCVAEALALLDQVANNFPGRPPITTVNAAFRSLQEGISDAA